MIPELMRPSTYIVELRKSFREIVRPGAPLSDTAVADLTARINSAYEIAVEYEDDMRMLERMLTPPKPAPSSTGSADIVPLRREPALRLVPSNGGGDAA